MYVRNTHATTVAVMLGLLVSGAGCAQTVDVRFEAPSGSVMRLDGESHELPETIALRLPDDNPLWGGAERRRSEVFFELPLEDDGFLAAEGVLDVYHFTPTDVDRYARNRCPIESHHIQSMRDGYAVVIDGHSASGQRIFSLTMGER